MVQMTLGIEEMACEMCEAHLNDAIRKAFKVKKVSSSHRKGETVIITEDEISENDLKEVIAPTGYVLESVKCEPYVKKSLFAFGK